MKTNYQLILHTNSYAGNFERELCAYCTGAVGECGVGSEFVEAEPHERFMNKIINKRDDYDCYRPCALDEDNSNNVVVFLSEQLTNEDLDFIEDRAKEFEISRPYEYLDPNFEFLGLTQIEITTSKSNL